MAKLQPTRALRQFWKQLGWVDVRAEQHIYWQNGRRNRIRWYESGDLDDIYLIVHITPEWRAAVYAIRFRMFSHFHNFSLPTDSANRAAEAQRMATWFDRKWFSDATARREFRAMHPECANWTWRRIQQLSPVELQHALSDRK